MKKNISYALIRIFQVLLIILFLDSYESANLLGRRFESKEGGFASKVIDNSLDFLVKSEIFDGVAITSGFNGGALGMSLISVSCLFLIGFMEIKLYENK